MRTDDVKLLIKAVKSYLNHERGSKGQSRVTFTGKMMYALREGGM